MLMAGMVYAAEARREAKREGKRLPLGSEAGRGRSPRAGCGAAGLWGGGAMGRPPPARPRAHSQGAAGLSRPVPLLRGRRFLPEPLLAPLPRAAPAFKPPG